MFDLHIHTTCSDGRFTPAEVVQKVIDAGITTFSITDHDTMAAYADMSVFKPAFDAGITLIPGIEISCSINNLPIEILVYNCFYGDMYAYVENLYKRKVEAQKALFYTYLKMADSMGFQVDLDAPYVDGSFAGCSFHGHLMQKEYNKNLLPEIVHESASFFHRLLIAKESGMFYMSTSDYPIPSLSAKEVCDAVIKLGGIPVVAHLGAYQLDEAQLLFVVESLFDSGIQGIELAHPCNSAQLQNKLLKILDSKQIHKNDLFLLTSGSDFHGSTSGRLGTDILGVYPTIEGFKYNNGL